MSLSFNSLTDHEKQQLSSVYTDTTQRDNVIRGITNFQDFKLTAAQLDTLNATPVTILPAPGAGLITVVTGVLTYLDFVTTALVGGGTLGFLLTDGSGAATATAVPNGTLISVADAYYYSVPLAVAPLVNTPIVAKTSADVTAGDSIVYGRIFYKTVRPADFF